MLRNLSVALLGLSLTACAGPVAEKAFNDMARETAPHLGGATPVWLRGDGATQQQRDKLAELLRAPLTADSAVAVALLNNPRLQSRFADLGMAAADLTSSWRPENPGFTFGQFRRGQEHEVERKLGIDILSLLALPIRAQIAERRMEQARLQAAVDVLALAAQVRRGFYEAVAAQQVEAIAARAAEAADVQSGFSERLHRAGNWSLLDQARGQLIAADAALQMNRSRRAAQAAREKLARLLGLPAANAETFRLPERLPALPPQPRDSRNIETAALDGRLDLRMARTDLEALAKAQGLTTATRFINVLELDLVRNSKSRDKDQTGYEIGFQIPLFDLGDAKATRAEALYLQGAGLLADMVVQVRSQAREAHASYQEAHALARQYETRILPLRQQIADEKLKRYNGMLLSVFDLLADVREQAAESAAAVEAQRDFWLADTDLTFVTLAPASAEPASAIAALSPKGAAPRAH